MEDFVYMVTITSHCGDNYLPRLFSRRENAIKYIKRVSPKPDFPELPDLKDLNSNEEHDPDQIYVDYHQESGTYQLVRLHRGIPYQISNLNPDDDWEDTDIAVDLRKMYLEDVNVPAHLRKMYLENA